MASTTLKRKKLKNRLRAKQRQHNIKKLNSKPVIKKVDVEALKQEQKGGPVKKAAKAVKEEVKDAAKNVKDEVKDVVDKATGSEEDSKESGEKEEK